MEKLVTIISKLMQSNFFGELLIKFESGKIVLLKKTETIKLE